ncbi:1-deoxy-D-xylulose-5-phosphate synthase [Actinomyces sp. B33]|uniref:1-deoxy-D-xylulose-5-phosphate synthase n=1 Tax=Actinomyces sp. B33 TaxID=2942131 RepID=UPI002341B593|nr:1-deoxy-D-xylulose-5-phosphate synthase [Actinomyces sp. B33]MDC4233199.1 1-deoxy-D-xylulose-5-phosphate synthase [Actinomyces sp. B33]
MSSSPEPRSLLARIHEPADLQALTPSELVDLAAQIREFLISSVSRTGGHLGPNLGVVEVTIALHRVLDSPTDTLIFDTGHQSYVHKLLTGRHDFSRLRSAGGLSGYPSRTESVHDVVESSHASSSLAWADGISREKRRANDPSWTVVVIGDGALTGGMAWEALNTIAASRNRRVMIVVNDNGRSYAPTIGALSRHLDALRTSEGYERALAWGKRHLLSMGEPGKAAYDALHGLKSGLKDVFLPQAMFEDLGLKYLGPVDGHDIVALETAFSRALGVDAPVLVHVITEKGRGYTPAEEDIADRFHAVGPIHPETGLPVAPARFGWTSVFAEEIVAIARERPDVIGITAAMMEPVGLAPFKSAFPDRVVDVGIAEQEAIASAAGMAFMGAHPVVALYATFLNRAFDQLLMDAALHRAGITVVLDRAGVTGVDGASHNGVWDIAMCQMIPGLAMAAPRDEATLREELREAVDVADRPTVVRYRKGALPEPMPALCRVGGVDVLVEPDEGAPARVLLVATGALVPGCVEAAGRLEEEGVAVRVVDPRWLLPVPEALVGLARGCDLVVAVEDGVVAGGFGWAVRDLLDGSGPRTVCLGIPREFIDHDEREAILARCGLDADAIAESIRGALGDRCA